MVAIKVHYNNKGIWFDPQSINILVPYTSIHFTEDIPKNTGCCATNHKLLAYVQKDPTKTWIASTMWPDCFFPLYKAVWPREAMQAH